VFSIPGSICQLSTDFVPHALEERITTSQITSNSTTDKLINIPVSPTSMPVPWDF